MLSFIKKNPYVLWVLYIPAYFATFIALEKRTDVDFHIIHSVLDDKIPFCEFFIIPYYMWFAFVFITVGILILKDKKEFNLMAWHLALGMTVFLLVSWLYPNKLELRPDTFPRENIFTNIVRFLYSQDTDTNVLPSIHVYNSLSVTIGMLRCKVSKDRMWVKAIYIVLTTLIIMSTVFLKQHSVIDVITAIFMGVIFYTAVYVIAPAIQSRSVKEEQAILQESESA